MKRSLRAVGLESWKSRRIDSLGDRVVGVHYSASSLGMMCIHCCLVGKMMQSGSVPDQNQTNECCRVASCAMTLALESAYTSPLELRDHHRYAKTTHWTEEKT